jgi:hypothetical protein
MKDNVIYDRGKIRNCPHNYAALGVWRTTWEFFGYRVQIKYIVQALQKSFIDAVPFLTNMVALPFMLVLLPVYPLIYAYFAVTKARKEFNNRRQTNGDQN